MRVVFGGIVGLLALVATARPAPAREPGRDLYMQRCFWCHGEEGKGDGPSAEGMIPAPRDLVAAEYKIRSTPHGELPTDEDLFGVISRGLPGTPMPRWERVLSEQEMRQLVSYLKSLSPRFETEKAEPLPVPGGTGSVEQGEEMFHTARCFVCHGEQGSPGDGITTALNFEWGLPHSARDFTRGWTFKGGHEPTDIYLRITGGINGTPMGPYQQLLSDQERWDLAHYVASLDRESSETSDDFTVVADYIEGEIPLAADTSEWRAARPTLVPLGGQVVLDPPSRWWTPTAGSAVVRALWNGRRIGFLLEWNDPTGPSHSLPDSALLQFAAQDGGKSYFLFGNSDQPVTIWQWNEGDGGEQWTASGSGNIASHGAGFQVSSAWKQGRWQVVFRGPLGEEPKFEAGSFVPILFSVRDGANAEIDNVRAISTWLYATLEPAPSPRPWLSALLWLLGAVIVEMWVVSRLQS